MVINAALDEECDISQRVVIVDDVVEEGVSLTANVGQRREFERGCWRIVGSAFTINAAFRTFLLEPGEVFVVVTHDDFERQTLPTMLLHYNPWLVKVGVLASVLTGYRVSGSPEMW